MRMHQTAYRGQVLNNNFARGFTLMELMITVSIVAILASIAYPSYTEQVRRSHRADATQTLQQYSTILERCRLNTFLYTNCAGAMNGSSHTSPQGYYAIAVATTANAYTLTATAQAGQTNDAKCAKFTLDNTGTRTAKNGANADSPDCWK